MSSKQYLLEVYVNERTLGTPLIPVRCDIDAATTSPSTLPGAVANDAIYSMELVNPAEMHIVMDQIAKAEKICFVLYSKSREVIVHRPGSAEIVGSHLRLRLHQGFGVPAATI